MPKLGDGEQPYPKWRHVWQRHFFRQATGLEIQGERTDDESDRQKKMMTSLPARRY
jgi:hypothetical protein